MIKAYCLDDVDDIMISERSTVAIPTCSKHGMRLALLAPGSIVRAKTYDGDRRRIPLGIVIVSFNETLMVAWGDNPDDVSLEPLRDPITKRRLRGFRGKQKC